jgi:hypothetical protein
VSVLEALGSHGEDDVLVEASGCASLARSGATQQRWSEGTAVRHQFHSRSDDCVGSRAKRDEQSVREEGACVQWPRGEGNEEEGLQARGGRRQSRHDGGCLVAMWTTVGRKGDGLRHGDPPVIRLVVGRTGNGRTVVHVWSTLESYRVVEILCPASAIFRHQLNESRGRPRRQFERERMLRAAGAARAFRSLGGGGR